MKEKITIEGINKHNLKNITIDKNIFEYEKMIINANNINQYYKKVIKPTEEELKLHKEYLKSSLKKNFF